MKKKKIPISLLKCLQNYDRYINNKWEQSASKFHSVLIVFDKCARKFESLAKTTILITRLNKLC